jgi:hypothetical protein
MKQKRLAYQLLSIALILTVTLACNLLSSPSLVPQPTVRENKEPESGGSFQLKVPATLDPKPESAAAALLDPSRIEEGVWFLLRGLGIGVYTGEGIQVLAGSETSPKDFWLYDFEVPLLVRLAQEPSKPFSEFQPQLNNLGLKPSQEENLKLYKDVYDANSSAYLARLFASMGLLFEGDPQITPLQEWLLLLDTFIPANPTVQSGQGQPTFTRIIREGMVTVSQQATGAGVGLFPGFAQVESCGMISGGTFQPNWGLVRLHWGTATTSELIGLETAYYAIHGPLLARSVKAELRPNKSKAHEGHGAPGGSITFTVSLKIDYGVGYMVLPAPICGFIINLDRPLAGALPGAKVWWKIISAFREHGTFKDVRGHAFDGSIPTETDPSGKTSITFQARQEPANGEGQVKTIKANIKASFNPRIPIEAMGLTDPRLLAFLPTTIDVSSPESVTLEWHAQPSFTVDGIYWGAYHLTGTICALDRPFTLKAEQSLGGEPGVGEFVFTPSSASGGSWKYDGTMCGQGICLTVNGSSTYQLDSSGTDVPTIQVNPGSNWTVTAPVVGTVPLGEGNHLGVIETIILTSLDTNGCSQP